jgi:hypothetical protein
LELLNQKHQLMALVAAMLASVLPLLALLNQRQVLLLIQLQVLH